MPSYRFVDYSQEESSGARVISVLSEQDIQRTLMQLQLQEPRFVDLFSPTGDCLTIGVGGSLACVMFARASGDPPYLWALGITEDREKELVFDAGGTPTPIPIRRCLPFESVLRIVVHYFLSGELSKDVEWDED
jgi:hypothetical protein